MRKIQKYKIQQRVCYKVNKNNIIHIHVHVHNDHYNTIISKTHYLVT